MVNLRTPYLVFPPGDFISEELDERGWTKKDLAEIMGRPQQMVSEIVNAKKSITPETAVQLSEAFGTSVELWLNLESDYSLWLARKEKSNEAIARRSNLYSLLPVAELKKNGWITDTRDVDILEADICKLLGVGSLDEKPNASVRLRGSAAKDPSFWAQAAWIKRVEILVHSKKPAPVKIESLKTLIRKLLGMSADTENIQRIPAMLSEFGVRFAIVPHLTGTYIDGAAFRINGAPVVALT